MKFLIKFFLVFFISTPHLLFSHAHEVNFPFNIICTKTDYSSWTGKEERFFKVIEGISPKELNLYEISTVNSDYEEERIKTSLVMHYFDKDFIALSESINGAEWHKNKRVYNIDINRKKLIVDFRFMIKKELKEQYLCDVLNEEINIDNYLYGIFIEYLKKDIKKNKI